MQHVLERRQPWDPEFHSKRRKCAEYGCNHEATKGDYGSQYCTCHWEQYRIVPCPADEKGYKA